VTALEREDRGLAGAGPGAARERAAQEDRRDATTVLVVEDNRDLLANLTEILEKRGYRVVGAPSARAGVERAASARPAVMLLDLNLPDGRGLEVLAAASRASPETATVILTGNASLESAIEAVNHGAYAYLVKGGRIEDVIATVDRAAEKVRLEGETRRLTGALRRERNFSRAVVSNAARAIAVVARDGRIVELNRKMRDLLGVGPAEASAAAAAYSDREALVALGRTPIARERIRAALSTEGCACAEREGREVDVDVRLAGGAHATWVISPSCVAGEDAVPDAVVAVVTDVTLERELQRRVVASTRLAAIGEMAARVAHEIRNPLAGIAGALRVLARPDAPAEKREAFSKELLALVGRLNAFVEDLLVLARPLRIVREPLTLERLVAPTLALLREHPALRRVTVEIEDRLGAPLHVDAHHMGLVLQNLLLNAAQALGGQGRVRIEAYADAPFGAVIAVSDDGPGIRPDLLPRLFEAFATSRPEGTGLGLSTTKRIVEAHGGSISAQNVSPGGARFEVRLPREEA
jgi:signal transduction histidine kinase